MNNLNNDRLSSFESHTDTKKPDVKMVWLLNLIPYSGAGYFYALGFKQAIKPMLFIWVFLFMFGPGTLLPMYFILSVLGTAHILNKNRTTANKLRQATLGKDIDSVSPGQQIPMTESSEFSLSTLEIKAKKAERALKRLSADEEEDKSKHAFEAFEYKAQAAEKMLKARNAATEAASFDPDPAINFAPAAAPKFSDEDSDDSAAPSVVPARTSEPTSARSSDSTDYIDQVNSSYSIDAEVANITAGVNLGASSNSQEVNNFLVQESASNVADLKLAQLGDSLRASQVSEVSMTDMLASADQNTAQIQSPNLVPDISSQVASSESYVPEVTAQYSTEPLALPSTSMTISGLVPDVSTQWVDSGLSAPDVNSQLVNSDVVVPEVNSQLVDSNQFAPDISSQLVNSTQATPDVNSQLVNSTQVAPDVNSQFVNSTQVAPEVNSQLVDSNQFAPDVSSQLVNSTQVAPDVSSQLADTSLTSFGNFESPKFSFSFEDHMATPVAGEAALGATSATTVTPCSKCGAARDPNFSFCLACGQSFL
ncbi:MAG: hypothetical protein HYX67_15710 [Candidatus Melainabacteria bacterium]|nr:hypothetical protein [Candidatus Melainabacteria bacterium]